MKRFLSLLIFTLISLQSAFASHIVGGEMYYEYLGNNQYKVYIALYRDCTSTGAQYDDPLALGIFDQNNTLVSLISVPFPGSVILPINFSNPCITTPSGICVERAIYTTIVDLPPTSGGYTLAYQRCCRTPIAANLNLPDEQGTTLTCHITGTSAIVNSSAHFNTYPPLVICNNENLIFDHSAIDADGDVLTYELVTPNAGASSLNPQPAAPPPPPYPLVNWGSSYSAAVPLGAGSTTTINPNTGLLFVDANLTGLFVVGIRVNEWRNGVIINSTTRDFIFKVVNCVVLLSAEVTEQEDTPGFISYCQGLTFTFDNQSFGATSYYWDFGVTGITTDNSTAFEPTYTFPAPGIYHVMLIANPGWPCTDTTYIDLNLNNPFQVDAIFTDSACFQDNVVDFTSVVTGPAGTQLSWDFGPNASPQNATTPSVNDVVFSSPTNNIIKLVGTFGVCADSVTYPLFFFAAPLSELEFEPNHECLGLTQTFINNSQNASSYHWDFGVGGITTDVSTQVEPTYTFPVPGTYPITLITEIVAGCSDTLQENITVYEPLAVSFIHNDSLCITDNSFNFVGTVTGPSITTYNWNFGSGATPATSTSLNVSNVQYSTPGSHPIQLTASFLNCSKSATSSVFVYRAPTIDFGVKDELRCAPHTAHFVSHCTADTDILYFWDFGDGGTSTEENPAHVYPNPGQYTVTLSIITVKGCLDTLTMTEVGLIVVHPNPISAFSIDKDYTDICNAEIQFFDHSQGAWKYEYVFDDINGATSGEENPVYTYAGDGFHNPYLVVTNEFGCSDVSRASLFIEPFTPYIPNTFTPDGNEFNNDFYAVLALEAVEWNMQVFNRWGELVFESNDQNEHWDGTYKDLEAKEGIYIYKVEYKPCGVIQDQIVLTGHVSLLR